MYSEKYIKQECHELCTIIKNFFFSNLRGLPVSYQIDAEIELSEKTKKKKTTTVNGNANSVCYVSFECGIT